MTQTKKPSPIAHPSACRQVERQKPVSFREALAILRAWRAEHPAALQLDGHPQGRNNLKPWLHLKLEGFSSPRHDYTTKHSREAIAGRFYNGIWNLHGDAKAPAIDRLLALATATMQAADLFTPTATYEAKAEHSGPQDPKLVLPGPTAAEGLYLYQTSSQV